MKQFLIGALLMAWFTVVFAGTGLTIGSVDSAGFNRLSESQKAEIIKKVAEVSAPESETSTVDKVDKWVTISSNLGKGLAATAKELGIAANEFAVSPLGRIATMLIVWHIMGGVLIHLAGGILIWVFGIIAVRHILNRMYPLNIKYDTTKRNIFGNHVITAKDADNISSDTAGSMLVCYAIVFGAGAVAIFTY